MSVSFRGWVLLLMVCSLVWGCQGRTGNSDPVALDLESDGLEPDRNSHDQMLADLERIRESTVEDHPFLGTKVLRKAEQSLKVSMGSAAVSPNELCQLHGLYGEELSRAGRTEEAIQEMEKALEIALKTEGMEEVRKHVRYRLGVICMRQGENSNCIHCTNGASCLLPILKAGQHADPKGSTKAIEHFSALLEESPDDLRAIWLLNIAHMTLGTYPDAVPPGFLIPASEFESAEGTQLRPFQNISHGLGLDARNPAGGIILDDFDGDDYLDIVTSSWDTADSLRFYRNNQDGTFSERVEEAGLKGIYGGLNMVQADYDNDGDVDVLVLRGAWLEQHGRHPNSLLRNDGKGRFFDVTYDVGLADVNFPTQTASWADYDNDGDLDLFIGNEGFPGQLFQNDGKGSFRDVAAQAGVGHVGMTKGSVWGDYDQDGWPDLYTSNLPGKNHLYHNQKDGTFRDVAEELGVSGPIYSFPVWFWDYDNDGLLDLYASSFEPGNQHVAADYMRRPVTCEPDRFYRGLPGGKFEDAAAEVGLTRVTQPMGSNFADINNDGFLDFYLGTGYVDYDGLIPNLMFLNRQGKRIEDVTSVTRTGHLQKGHGVAFGDMDNDGDQDLFAQLGGWFTGDAFPNAFFENPGATDQGHWIGVRLVGQKSNRSAIGARIHVIVGQGQDEKHFYRWVNSGGSFGCNPLRQQIGIGTADRIQRLEIFWPTTGETQTFNDLAVDQRIEITESQPEYRTVTLKTLKWKGTSDAASP